MWKFNYKINNAVKKMKMKQFYVPLQNFNENFCDCFKRERTPEI